MRVIRSATATNVVTMSRDIALVIERLIKHMLGFACGSPRSRRCEFVIQRTVQARHRMAVAHRRPVYAPSQDMPPPWQPIGHISVFRVPGRPEDS